MDTIKFKDDFDKAVFLMVYEDYQNFLKEQNALDFGDILMHMITILSTNNEVLQKYLN